MNGWPCNLSYGLLSPGGAYVLLFASVSIVYISSSTFGTLRVHSLLNQDQCSVLCLCMYVCMYVCVCMCVYVCMYVCIYVCIYV